MTLYEYEASVGAATERRGEREREREESPEKGWRETGQIGGRGSSDVCIHVIEADGRESPPSLHCFILLFHNTIICNPVVLFFF